MTGFTLLGHPSHVEDALGRQTVFTVGTWVDGIWISSIMKPEQNALSIARDDRNNVTLVTAHPKPGQGTVDVQLYSASYPVDCINPKTCNKPVWTRDGKGNQTDYTYSPDHGGLVTETRPAVNGIGPRKLYEYEQRSPWLMNSSGGHSAGTQQWVLVRERSCRTTAASGTGCAGGTADEVVTHYDYGPASGPNNLVVRGIAIVADGQTLRTCYRYDASGRRISETSPRAGLAACP
jgi:YD repeat-containing protein